MSTITKEAGEQLLAQEVYAPVFFQKLASHGVIPQSESEASELLALANDLRQQYTLHQQKTASTRTQQLRALRANLSGQPAAAAKQDSAIFEQLGKQAAQIPALHAAVLATLA